MECEIFQQPGRVEIPDPRPDGVCCGCLTKIAVTKDGRFCRGCLRKLVCQLNPGATRSTAKTPSGTRLIDRSESREDRPYRELVRDGSIENAVRVMEGD